MAGMPCRRPEVAGRPSPTFRRLGRFSPVSNVIRSRSSRAHYAELWNFRNHGSAKNGSMTQSHRVSRELLGAWSTIRAVVFPDRRKSVTSSASRQLSPSAIASHQHTPSRRAFTASASPQRTRRSDAPSNINAVRRQLRGESRKSAWNNSSSADDQRTGSANHRVASHEPDGGMRG